MNDKIYFTKMWYRNHRDLNQKKWQKNRYLWAKLIATLFMFIIGVSFIFLYNNSKYDNIYGYRIILAFICTELVLSIGMYFGLFRNTSYFPLHNFTGQPAFAPIAGLGVIHERILTALSMFFVLYIYMVVAFEITTIEKWNLYICLIINTIFTTFYFTPLITDFTLIETNSELFHKRGLANFERKEINMSIVFTIISFISLIFYTNILGIYSIKEPFIFSDVMRNIFIIYVILIIAEFLHTFRKKIFVIASLVKNFSFSADTPSRLSDPQIETSGVWPSVTWVQEVGTGRTRGDVFGQFQWRFLWVAVTGGAIIGFILGAGAGAVAGVVVGSFIARLFNPDAPPPDLRFPMVRDVVSAPVVRQKTPQEQAIEREPETRMEKCRAFVEERHGELYFCTARGDADSSALPLVATAPWQSIGNFEYGTHRQWFRSNAYASDLPDWHVIVLETDVPSIIAVAESVHDQAAINVLRSQLQQMFVTRREEQILKFEAAKHSLLSDTQAAGGKALPSPLGSSGSEVPKTI